MILKRLRAAVFGSLVLVCIGQMGVLAPSLLRESTDSLIYSRVLSGTEPYYISKTAAFWSFKEFC